MKYLTQELIQADEFSLTKTDQRSSAVPSPPFSSGASVIFFGMIRDHSADKDVLYLEYEAFETMAEKMIGNLVASAFRQWPLEKIDLLHRLGRVNLGEIAVAIEVRAAHRDEAYQESRYLIDEIKHNVPIWKKEYFADGTSEWGVCNHESHPHPSPLPSREREFTSSLALRGEDRGEG